MSFNKYFVFVVLTNNNSRLVRFHDGMGGYLFNGSDDGHAPFCVFLFNYVSGGGGGDEFLNLMRIYD